MECTYTLGGPILYVDKIINIPHHKTFHGHIYNTIQQALDGCQVCSNVFHLDWVVDAVSVKFNGQI